MRVFGRDPALWLALVATVVQMISAFVINVPDETQGAINAVALAVAGLATAWAVARDKLVPAILGLAQAALSLALAFGWEVSADEQAVIMAFVATAVGMFVRTQVTAPVTADGQRVA